MDDRIKEKLEEMIDTIMNNSAYGIVKALWKSLVMEIEDQKTSEEGIRSLLYFEYIRTSNDLQVPISVSIFNDWYSNRKDRIIEELKR